MILGKDTDEHLKKLETIQNIVENSGYKAIIIKNKEEIVGESVMQKVLRYAMQSKFVIVENSETSGHLYELPHIIKTAEKISAIIQLEGKGSTWMFEDLYPKLNHLKKFKYTQDNNFIIK